MRRFNLAVLFLLILCGRSATQTQTQPLPSNVKAQVDKVFEPQWTRKQREDGLAGWKKAVNRTLHWVEKEPAKAKATAGRSKKK